MRAPELWTPREKALSLCYQWFSEEPPLSVMTYEKFLAEPLDRFFLSFLFNASLKPIKGEVNFQDIYENGAVIFDTGRTSTSKRSMIYIFPVTLVR